jgi:hypothetical protein
MDRTHNALLIGGGLFLVWVFTNKAAAQTVDYLGGALLQSPDNWPTGDPIWDVCRAIAHAEGFDVAGSAPQKLNNPGDLSPGDEHGSATAGAPEFHGGSYIIHFSTPQDGWDALYAKFANIQNGESSVYDAGWTWLQIGAKYASDPNWGRNVAATLGVDPNSTLADYLGGA